MNDIFTKELLGQLGEPVGKKLEQANVVTRDQAMQAMEGLSPVLLGGLKRRQAELDDEGMEELFRKHGAAENDIEDIDAALDRHLGKEVEGQAFDGILEPEKEEQTVQALSQKMGVSQSVVKKLLPMLIPVIMGMLMKKGGQNAHAGQSRASGIGAILDRDGDGQIIDDIAGMVISNMSGGRGASTGNRGGFLGMILGMLFGRK